MFRLYALELGLLPSVLTAHHPCRRLKALDTQGNFVTSSLRPNYGNGTWEGKMGLLPSFICTVVPQLPQALRPRPPLHPMGCGHTAPPPVSLSGLSSPPSRASAASHSAPYRRDSVGRALMGNRQVPGPTVGRHFHD